MNKWILSLVAALYGGIGVHMWLAPLHWYTITPGVAMMGPYNAHFVRDIALIFLVSAAALAWGGWKQDRTAGVIGAAWPCLHALFHVWIWATMRQMALDHVALVNLLGIQAPAWLALWAAYNIHDRRTGT